VLHHLDEAEHRPDNADRGRKTARRLEDFRNFLLLLGLIVEFQGSGMLASSRSSEMMHRIRCPRCRLRGQKEHARGHVEKPALLADGAF
jgi:hypothetical protein